MAFDVGQGITVWERARAGLYVPTEKIENGRDDIVAEVKPIIWLSDAVARGLREHLSSDPKVIASAQEFLDEPRAQGTVAFLDAAALDALDQLAAERGTPINELLPPGSVIAIGDDVLQTPIGWLPARPWLSHVISAALLKHPYFPEHLGNIVATLTNGRRPRLTDWLAPSVLGRRVRLAQASKRAERIERMGEYFESHKVSSRTIQLLRDAAEEMLTNAFYDAPVAAGVVSHAIPRTQDVVLSDESACDMVYGCRDDLAVVRVKDPFGSLTRERLIEVLTRCARTDMQVEVDESMGGAGLGLWRLFTVATFVAISVVPNRHTEVLVGIAKRGAPGSARPYAFHLFFKEPGRALRRWQMLDANTSNPPLDQSINIVAK